MNAQSFSEAERNLIYLIAYIIQCDPVVTDEEVNYVSKFIKNNFDSSASDVVFNLFLEALDAKPSLDIVLNDLNTSYANDVKGKLSLVLKLYELIAADSVDPRELKLFETICVYLGVNEVDMDLISSLMDEDYSFHYMENAQRVLHIGSDSASADIVFPAQEASTRVENFSGEARNALRLEDNISYNPDTREIKMGSSIRHEAYLGLIDHPDLKDYADVITDIYKGRRILSLAIFELGNEYYLVNTSSNEIIYIDNDISHPRSILPLAGRGKVIFKNGKISVNDIPLYFRIKRENIAGDFYFKFSQQSLQTELDPERADFRISIDKNITRFYRLNGKIDVTINDIGVEDFEFVNLTDLIVVDRHYQVPIRNIVSGTEQNEFLLSEYSAGKDVLVISNKDIGSDFYIDDVEEEELRVSIRAKHERSGFRFSITPEKCPYPVLLMDRRIEEYRTVEAFHHCRLRIGSHQFLFDCERGKVTRTLLRVYSLKVHRLSYSINGVKIIDDISFEAGPGELNCIMGVSGAGKSTLLKLMLGYLKPDRNKKPGIMRSFFRKREGEESPDDAGCVLINGVNLQKNFHYLKKSIAYVPQEDLLFDNLSVYQNLYYAAKLRMPDKSKTEIEHQVASVLKDVGLFDKKDERVGSVVDKVLSGGQRKRLNIAFELLSNPDIYFLDEPTSGLSSIDSENVIQLLSDLSRRGKIIYVVIHQPSSEIYKKFDNLLLLDAGGKLAFYGSAYKAVNYFKPFLARKNEIAECPSCKNLKHELIFEALEQKVVGRDGLPVYREEKVQAGLIQRLLFRKEKTVTRQVRKYNPDFWKQLFITRSREQSRGDENESDGLLCTTDDMHFRDPAAEGEGAFLDKISILISHFRRAFADKCYDKTNLSLTFILPTVLGLLMSYSLKGGPKPYYFKTNDEISKFFFLTVIVFIFSGLMASISQIIKDRPIIIREKLLDITSGQYIMSKSAVFLIFSALQVLIFISIGIYVLEIPVIMPPGISLLRSLQGNFWLYLFFTCLITSYVSFLAGLLVSSFMKSEFAALNVAIFIILLQIIFGGLFIQYSKLPVTVFDKYTDSFNGRRMISVVPWYCNITFSRWAYEALLVGADDLNPVSQIETGYLSDADREGFERLKQRIHRIPSLIDKSSFDEKVIMKFKVESIPLMRADLVKRMLDRLGASSTDENAHADLKNFINSQKESRKKLFQAYYTSADGDRANYHIVKIPDMFKLHNRKREVKKRNDEIRELFKISHGGDGVSFNSVYSLYEPNETIRTQIVSPIGKNEGDTIGVENSWNRKRDFARKGMYEPSWSEWFAGFNPYPTREKLFHVWIFNTRWYNLCVLLFMSIVFSGLLWSRLRSENG